MADEPIPLLDGTPDETNKPAPEPEPEPEPAQKKRRGRPPKEKIPTFAERMCACMLEIGGIGKMGVNDHFGYSYTRAEDLIAKVQHVVAEHGLFLLTQTTLLEDSQPHLCMVQTRVTATDGTDSASASGLGSGQDRGDKAIMKADTAAFKYALARLFCIPFGIDPEADTRTDTDATADNQPATPEAVKAAKRATLRRQGGDKDKAAAYWRSVCEMAGLEEGIALTSAQLREILTLMAGD